MSEEGDKAYFKRISSYEDWYAASSERWNGTLLICRSATFVSTIGAALLTALIEPSQFAQYRIPIVVLAALGTASSTFLAEFRVLGLQRLREQGRVEAQHLVNYAHDKLEQYSEDPTQKARIKDEIRNRLTALEARQGRNYSALAEPDRASPKDPAPSES